MSEQKGRKPPPLVLSMIVCDDVIRDEMTKKTTIVGAFSSLVASNFPAFHASLVIFLELTNGHGETEVSVRLVDAATNEALSGMTSPITFPDPRAVFALRLGIRNIIFPKAGEYRFQLFFDGVLELERRLLVHHRPLEG